MANQAAPTPNRSYEDFEPFCKWKTEPEHDILVVHVHGYKKDQLRVQIYKTGVLTITGERPLDENRWNRFRKEIRVSKDCKSNEIRAKLSAAGILSITMPKRTPLIPQDQPTLPQQKQENEKPKPDTSQVTKDSTIIKDSSAKENVTTTEIASKPRNYVTGIKCSSSKLKMGKKTSVAVAVSVVVLVALGAYMAYRYRQSSQDEN